MVDHLLHDLRVLRKADLLIGRIWLTVLARRVGFLALGALIAAFGLAMANLAGFYALQPPLGTPGAAAALAAGDLAIAAVLLWLGSTIRPGPEIEVALDVRTMAVEALEADTRDLKLMVDTIGQELNSVRTNIAHIVHNPLDLAAQKLLIPAALSLLRGLRSKSGQD
jgi:hypothetical protein